MQLWSGTSQLANWSDGLSSLSSYLSINNISNYKEIMIILGNSMGGRTQNVFVLERNPKTTWVEKVSNYGGLYTDSYYTITAVGVDFTNNRVYGMFNSNGWSFKQTLVGVYGRYSL